MPTMIISKGVGLSIRNINYFWCVHQVLLSLGMGAWANNWTHDCRLEGPCKLYIIKTDWKSKSLQHYDSLYLLFGIYSAFILSSWESLFKYVYFVFATGFCYRKDATSNECSMKNGNPFGPFWNKFNINFDGSQEYSPLSFSSHSGSLKAQWDNT